MDSVSARLGINYSDKHVLLANEGELPVTVSLDDATFNYYGHRLHQLFSACLTNSAVDKAQFY